jgi:pyruvate dehydrogenase E2 component (dihydrolipoamide acetyltransferase)
MAYEVVMPQLGLSMDKGQIIEWLKKPGDLVHSGDLLMIVESDKAALEVEAVESGRLKILHTPEDGPAFVGQVIAYLLSEDEQLPDIAVSSTPSAQSIPRRPPSTPAARRRAHELDLDWTQALPTGSRGQVRQRDVEALATKEQPLAQSDLRISPVARRLAESLGLDLGLLGQMYPHRRIDRAEVEMAVRQLLHRAVSSPSQAELPKDLDAGTADFKSPSSHRRPAGSLRMLIAERMLNSARATAPVTLTTSADATELMKIRDGFKVGDSSRPVPGYNVLLAILVSKALQEHPDLNATLEGNEIVYRETVNIGIAVNTERGLVVPVIRAVQSKNLTTLVEEAADLLSRAAVGKALPDELSGGTFTITNLGAYEIDAFTPIINFPECAILGVGRLVPQVVPVGNQPAIRMMLTLSLTFDHRVVDGAPAAAFLQRIKQFVEHPYLGLF